MHKHSVVYALHSLFGTRHSAEWIFVRAPGPKKVKVLLNDGCGNQILVQKCKSLKIPMFNLCSHLKQTDFRRRWCSSASEPGGGDGGGRCLSVCLSKRLHLAELCWNATEEPGWVS